MGPISVWAGDGGRVGGRRTAPGWYNRFQPPPLLLAGVLQSGPRRRPPSYTGRASLSLVGPGTRACFAYVLTLWAAHVVRGAVVGWYVRC